MRIVCRYLLAGLLFGLGGCASLLDGSNEISVRENAKPATDAAKPRYAVSIRVARYTDGRKLGDARLVGTASGKVIGMRGSEIRLDRDAADVVADCMSERLDDAGFQVLASSDKSAMFELRGEIGELSYDVKDRDYVSIKVASTLTEIATGKVIWSGEAAQKSDRYAGVSGNNREDIGYHLHNELEVVSGKTAEAIGATLMATRSELFNLTPGTKVIPGVTVFVTPGKESDVRTTPSPTMPTAANGLLTVRSEPTRAKVYVDGVYHGMTPLSVEATPGIHAVEVKLKGYRTVAEKVAVRKGDSTELEVSLEK
ncbi:MAG: PEGA domain-containing protein [Gammaproteobacteria bacterium]|nr:PEGA domain-containing protein [Gammaproteobacteria bacterium]MBU1968545.1 PEGA domain-containing protein [Gammaproteobacteria bacterium]